MGTKSEKSLQVSETDRHLLSLADSVTARCEILRARTQALYDNNKLLTKNNAALENRIKSLDELIDTALTAGNGDI